MDKHEKGEVRECLFWVHEKCVGLYMPERESKGMGKGKKSSVQGGEDEELKCTCPDHRK